MLQDPAQGRDRRRGAPTLDLETLPREVRAAVEAMVAGRPVTLRHEGRDVGVLAFRKSVLEGTVVSGPTAAAESAPPETVPDGVTVVATATKLSDAARRRLSDELGSDYIVLDLLKAPPTADVVLTHPVSPQLLGALRAGFPNARVIVTEIDDEELGVSAPGPVSRLLDAGLGVPAAATSARGCGQHACLSHRIRRAAAHRSRPCGKAARGPAGAAARPDGLSQSSTVRTSHRARHGQPESSDVAEHFECHPAPIPKRDLTCTNTQGAQGSWRPGVRVRGAR